MASVFAIFKREFLGYFRTPIAYVVLALFLMFAGVLAWMRPLGNFFASNNANLTIYFWSIIAAFVIFIPAIGMRLWAEEKRSGTWELLFTLPITTLQAVVGKFLAGWAFVLVALALTFTMPLTVAGLGSPDYGPMISGYIGLALVGAAALSVCSLTSALTRSQVISFVLSLVAIFILTISGFSALNDYLSYAGAPVWLIDAIANFSFVTHFTPMANGLISFTDVVYFLSIIVFSLFLNVVVLER